MELAPNTFLTNLSIILKERRQLEELCAIFRKDHNLTVSIGVELEFYLSTNIIPAKFAELLKLDIKQEKGDHQFEIDLPPSSDLTRYSGIIEETKEKIRSIAILLEGAAYLSPKPFKNDYGNSMHIHISFNQSTEELLDHAARSLCHFMLETCMIFMPTDEDYLRLDSEFMAPTHVSFGNNNRSVAIRMPNSSPKRLEHRLASLSSDPYLVLCTILQSILFGLNHPDQIQRIPKIYGNAYEDQYNMSSLPLSLKEAEIKFNYNFFDNLITL